MNSAGNVEFNSESTILTAKSNYGANGIGGYGNIDFNGKNATINAIVTDGVGKANAIGILVGNNLDVSQNVEKFNIVVEGAGVDNGKPGNSNGTAGIYGRGGNTEINSQNLNITVTAGQDTANSIFDITQVDKDYSNTHGIRVDAGGEVNVGSATATVINVTDGYKNAIGLYASLSPEASEAQYGAGTISILGNTTITVTGKTASNALLAEDGGQINVGSAGKTVNLTGDVKVDGGTVTNIGDTTINGRLIVKNNGTGSEYTSTGERLSVDGGSAGTAVEVENNGNILNFHAKNTELKADGDSYSYAFYVAANTNSNEAGRGATVIDFAGDTTKITATAIAGRAHGLRINRNAFGGANMTSDITFGSATTNITVGGNVAADDYSEQVAGIWSSGGGLSYNVSSNITFTGNATIDVSSKGGNAYGIFIEKGQSQGTMNIDFQDNTVISTHNADGSGDAVYVDGADVSVSLGSAGKTVSLTGDVTALNDAEITLAGDTNTVKGTVTADAGIVFLAGGDKATYTVNL